jgi:hypothetical protein
MSFDSNINITAFMLMTRRSSGVGGSVGLDVIPEVSGDRLHILYVPSWRSILTHLSIKMDDLNSSD